MNPKFLSFAALASSAAALGSTSRAETGFHVLQQWYSSSTGLWNTMGWWNGANALTMIGDLAAVDSNIKSTAESVFSNTYSHAPAQRPAGLVMKQLVNGEPVTTYEAAPASEDDASSSASSWQNWVDTCYDDNGWWALAWIQAYDITGNANYLTTAQGIFDNNITHAGPTNCSDGGIIWCSTSYYVNAIANELYLSVAAHLARRVTSNASTYLSIAEKQWQWFKSSGMINSQGTINDGLTSACKNNGETVWSYNQGVILGGLVELNKANGDSSLLTSAGSIATAAIGALCDSNYVVHDKCEPNCAPDATQFKGIFIRNLVALYEAAPQALYAKVINASANSIWQNDRNSQNQFSVDWSGPFVNPANASTHSSAMDAMVAQILIS